MRLFPEFIDMLASMRTGVLADWHKEEFQKLCREIHYDDGISPTQLYVMCLPQRHCLHLFPLDFLSKPKWSNTTSDAWANYQVK